MTESKLPAEMEDAAASAAAAAELSANMAKVMDQSRDIWMRLMQAQMADEHPMHADPLNAMPAFTELQQTLMAHPQEVAERTLQLWTQQMELWRRATSRFIGTDDKAEPLKAPARGDKRFRADEWSENVAFDYIKQSYLLASDYIQGLADEVGDLPERDRKKASFYTRQFVEAMSPSNFAAMNPEVINATLDEKGENLVRGLDMMAKDLERGKGRLIIRQTDMEAFEVGRDMATTPGKVVFRNELFELIQYSPTTEEVMEVPLLICPPWINKYYILDLNEKKSMVRWLVSQGFTVFMISWINPTEAQKDETWQSYQEKGLMTAVDKVLEETGAKRLNLASYCIGATMAATTLARMAKEKDRRVGSVTFFTALVDFDDPGELGVFVDEETLKVVDEQMDKGFLPAESMANAFNMLRASDLIWGYVVNNYYLGKDPFPFDLLYWNADSTAMPARVHHFYLDRFYNDNAFSCGDFRLAGHTLTPADIEVPVYHVAAKEDHIAPAAAVYRGARMMTGAKDLRFVLAGSGHIAGVVNPPDMKKYQFWTNADMTPEDMPSWLDGAEETPGSWWTDWAAWLKRRAGKKVAARAPAQVLEAVCDAPGDYVRVRFDKR